MAKKIVILKDKALVQLALPVPANTPADTIVALGANGLKGYTETTRATVATIADGTSAPGLADGEASVILIGCSLVIKPTVDAAIAQFAKVYITAAGVYTPTVGANTFVGYALAALAAAGEVEIAVTSV